jgi:hypothetical protein
MMWLEMISIRTAGVIEAAKVFELCRQSFQSIDHEKLLKLTVYCNAKYATDISIHLQWKSDPGTGNILGRELSAALGDLGLINHTLWIEQEEFTTCDTSETSSNERTINVRRLNRKQRKDIKWM